ncbi:hypothetical protein Tco_1281288 [Tanacetum coccineum]
MLRLVFSPRRGVTIEMLHLLKIKTTEESPSKSGSSTGFFFKSSDKEVNRVILNSYLLRNSISINVETADPDSVMTVITFP